MAPPKKEEKKKRRNKRKSRTEVSSASESSDSDTTPAPAAASSQVKKGVQSAQDETSDVEMENTDISIPAEKKIKVDGEKTFEEFYLRQATREFGEDLEKLRNASDWKGEQSLEMLVRGLKSGARGFGVEEKGRVVGVGGEEA